MKKGCHLLFWTNPSPEHAVSDHFQFCVTYFLKIRKNINDHIAYSICCFTFLTLGSTPANMSMNLFSKTTLCETTVVSVGGASRLSPPEHWTGIPSIVPHVFTVVSSLFLLLFDPCVELSPVALSPWDPSPAVLASDPDPKKLTGTNFMQVGQGLTLIDWMSSLIYRDSFHLKQFIAMWGNRNMEIIKVKQH